MAGRYGCQGLELKCMGKGVPSILRFSNRELDSVVVGSILLLRHLYICHVCREHYHDSCRYTCCK
jgi:hypothetical protein